MNFFKILTDSFFNLISIMGIFIFFGLIFNIIEEKNNRLLQKTFGVKSIIFTGFIGTVVHELSHLLMALLFNHKIIAVELFRPKKYKNDGVLGFVKHTYNSKSLYQQIGNFFIGIAPMIFGTFFIWVLLILLSNNSYQTFISNLNINLYNHLIKSYDFYNLLKLLFNDIFNFIKTILSFNYLFNIKHLILLFLIYSITTHMSLSLSDLKGSLKGLSVCFLVIFIITFLNNILGLYNIFTSIFVLKVNIYILLFLSVGLVFSFITLLISFLLYIVKK
ncbi:hypothetical protein [Paraclostridium sordellii]|uniref:hypothetical protein n=1 Tax=Paraclostridium sordellii TaxID=1505 RepID=UPI0005DC0DFE|nr:hypothetical protein [Paeniclostridium sordellii]CEN22961.1 membrane protein [[Clostridium] sordellii] [Paeniclostridium sordellii]CEN95402.1 membrane protein [[Clostridium] sordellii] [Paeniclostridium sordellii]